MEFDKKKFKVYTWKNWMVMLWILNPGLAFNELILGQRLPKICLEDKTSKKPRWERSLVSCPHCKKLHDGRTWSTQSGTAFKNWFGLYCPACGNVIPCLINATSLIILVVTFPIWYFFYKYLRKKWIIRQPKRYENLKINTICNPFGKGSWIITGLTWGGMMFLFMTLLYPYFMGLEITLSTILIGFVVWLFGGLGFGYTMKIYMNKTVGDRF